MVAQKEYLSSKKVGFSFKKLLKVAPSSVRHKKMLSIKHLNFGNKS